MGQPPHFNFGRGGETPVTKKIKQKIQIDSTTNSEGKVLSKKFLSLGAPKTETDSSP